MRKERSRLYKIILTLLVCALILAACFFGRQNKRQKIQNQNPEIEKTETEKQETEKQETEKQETGDQETGDQETEKQKNGKLEISMEEAIEIGKKEADKYYANLKLTEVHSYDNDSEPDIKAGADGKRQWWYVNFGNEALNYVNILIQNGEILAVEKFDENGNNGVFDFSKIQLTSKDAALKAKALGLSGGNPDNEAHWAFGYHFKLSFASLAESPEDKRIFLEVIGISPNGNFAHVDFDAITGELLLAEEKIEDNEEQIFWKIFANTME